MHADFVYHTHQVGAEVLEESFWIFDLGAIDLVDEGYLETFSWRLVNDVRLFQDDTVVAPVGFESFLDLPVEEVRVVAQDVFRNADNFYTVAATHGSAADPNASVFLKREYEVTCIHALTFR